MKIDPGMKVDVVMATFNGAAYLSAQLDSLLEQKYPHWRVLIRDDGSQDNTPALLKEYAGRHPQRIELMTDDKGPLGVVGNFSALLAATDAPYVMCCDQDDVWLPGKMRATLQLMRGQEEAYGKNAPLLVHTDAMITDAALRVTAASRMRYHKLNPAHSPFSRLLVQNTVQGCSMMLNRALVEQVLPIPPSVRMYDMWIAQVAAGLGHIDYLDQATLYYRQHTKNLVGAGKSSLGRAARIRQIMTENSTQAKALLERFGNVLAPDYKTQAQALISLTQQKPLDRCKSLIRHGLLREPLWQNLAVLLLG